MKIAKAVFLTILFLFIEAAIQLLSYTFLDYQNNFEHFDHVLGVTLILARITAYLVIFYFFWNGGNGKLFNKTQNLSLRIILFILLIVFGSEFLMRPFVDLNRFLENSPANFVYNGYSTYRLYTTATALIIAPVFEELFFRRFLFKNLLLKNGFLTALLASSFVFSLIHWETPLNLFPAFIVGIINAILYHKTKNILYPILLHFLYNFLNQVYYYKAELYSQWLNWLDFGILYWSLFVFGIIITLFALQHIPHNRSAITSEE